MTQSTITTDVHQSFYVQLPLRPKLPFYEVLVFDDPPELTGLLIGPFARMKVVIDLCAVEDLPGQRAAYAEDRCKRNLTSFVVRNVNSCNSWHNSNPINKQAQASALALFMLRVFLVDDINTPFATNDFVVSASLLYTCLYFHNNNMLP